MKRERNLSCAIFAPGWTYELPHRENRVEIEFMDRENLFWENLEPFLNFQVVIRSDLRSGIRIQLSAYGLRIKFVITYIELRAHEHQTKRISEIRRRHFKQSLS